MNQPTGEFSSMTQQAAILKALEHGAQTTREIYDRLRAGGLTLKKPTYVTALLPRLRERVERIEGNKIQLKQTI